MMDGSNMAVEIGPSEPSEVAGRIGTVVPQEQDSVAHDVFVCVPDTDVIISTGKIGVRVFLESLRSVVSENYIRRSRLVARRLACQHKMEE